MAKRRVGHDWDFVLPAPGRQLKFDSAVLQIVKHLIGRAVRSIFYGEEFLHVLQVEIGNSPALDLPGRTHLLERFHGFSERRCLLAPVEQVKIDNVDTQTFQTALAYFRQLCPRRVVWIDFCNNKHAVALSRDRFSNNFFRASVSIHLGSVDQRHAEFDSKSYRFDLILARALALAHAPGSLTKSRDFGGIRK